MYSSFKLYRRGAIRKVFEVQSQRGGSPAPLIEWFREIVSHCEQFLRITIPYKLRPRSRNELPITETELKLIAAAAIIGFNSKPIKG